MNISIDRAMHVLPHQVAAAATNDTLPCTNSLPAKCYEPIEMCVAKMDTGPTSVSLTPIACVDACADPMIKQHVGLGGEVGVSANSEQNAEQKDDNDDIELMEDMSLLKRKRKSQKPLKVESQNMGKKIINGKVSSVSWIVCHNLEQCCL